MQYRRRERRTTEQRYQFRVISTSPLPDLNAHKSNIICTPQRRPDNRIISMTATFIYPNIFSILLCGDILQDRERGSIRRAKGYSAVILHIIASINLYMSCHKLTSPLTNIRPANHKLSAPSPFHQYYHPPQSVCT